MDLCFIWVFDLAWIRLSVQLFVPFNPFVFMDHIIISPNGPTMLFLCSVTQQTVPIIPGYMRSVLNHAFHLRSCIKQSWHPPRLSLGGQEHQKQQRILREGVQIRRNGACPSQREEEVAESCSWSARLWRWRHCTGCKAFGILSGLWFCCSC